MLNQSPFRHDLLRRYSMVVGALFNEIFITRRDADGDTTDAIKVPLSYAPKEKVLARLMADPKIDRPMASILPRMSFELTSLTYNGDRKLRSAGLHFVNMVDDETKLERAFNPVPYDLKFTVWVYTKYVEDGNQIIEQILPWFTPHFTATAELIPGLATDVQVKLDSVHQQDVYDGDYTKRRTIMWTLELTVMAYLWGPVKNHPIIKFANVNFYDAKGPTAGQKAIDRVTAQPGLTANGEPTTNVDLSIEYVDIPANSNYDYIMTIYGRLDPSDS